MPEELRLRPEDLIRDPKFYELDLEARRFALAQVDPDRFGAMDAGEQNKVLAWIETQRPRPTPPGTERIGGLPPAGRRPAVAGLDAGPPVEAPAFTDEPLEVEAQRRLGEQVAQQAKDLARQFAGREYHPPPYFTPEHAEAEALKPLARSTIEGTARALREMRVSPSTMPVPSFGPTDQRYQPYTWSQYAGRFIEDFVQRNILQKRETIRPLTEPYLKFEKLFPDPRAGENVELSYLRAVAEAGSEFTTPASIAFLIGLAGLHAIPVVGSAIGTAVLGIVGAAATFHAGKQIKRGAELWREGKLNEAAREWGFATVDGLLASLSARAAIRGLPELAKLFERARAERASVLDVEVVEPKLQPPGSEPPPKSGPGAPVGEGPRQPTAPPSPPGSGAQPGEGSRPPSPPPPPLTRQVVEVRDAQGRLVQVQTEATGPAPTKSQLSLLDQIIDETIRLQAEPRPGRIEAKAPARGPERGSEPLVRELLEAHRRKLQEASSRLVARYNNLDYDRLPERARRQLHEILSGDPSTREQLRKAIFEGVPLPIEPDSPLAEAIRATWERHPELRPAGQKPKPALLIPTAQPEHTAGPQLAETPRNEARVERPTQEPQVEPPSLDELIAETLAANPPEQPAPIARGPEAGTEDIARELLRSALARGERLEFPKGTEQLARELLEEQASRLVARYNNLDYDRLPEPARRQLHRLLSGDETTREEVSKALWEGIPIKLRPDSPLAQAIRETTERHPEFGSPGAARSGDTAEQAVELRIPSTGPHTPTQIEPAQPQPRLQSEQHEKELPALPATIERIRQQLRSVQPNETGLRTFELDLGRSRKALHKWLVEQWDRGQKGLPTDFRVRFQEHGKGGTWFVELPEGDLQIRLRNVGEPASVALWPIETLKRRPTVEGAPAGKTDQPLDKTEEAQPEPASPATGAPEAPEHESNPPVSAASAATEAPPLPTLNRQQRLIIEALKRQADAVEKYATLEITRGPAPERQEALQRSMRSLRHYAAQLGLSEPGPAATPEAMREVARRVRAELEAALEFSGLAKPRKQAPAKLQLVVAGLRQSADKLTPVIERLRGPARGHARAQRNAENLAREVERLERLQTALRALADAMEQDRLPPSLARIRNRSQVQQLLEHDRYPGPGPLRTAGIGDEQSFNEAKADLLRLLPAQAPQPAAKVAAHRLGQEAPASAGAAEGGATTAAASRRQPVAAQTSAREVRHRTIVQGEGPKALVTRGEATAVLVPGETRRYQAHYAIMEADDVIASVDPESFQPNPDYPYVNDRDYSKPINQQRVRDQRSPGKFDPAFLVTDDPSPENGPTMVERYGRALGGNARALIIKWIYEREPELAERYKELLARKARQFGIEPTALNRYRRPVLVRVLELDEDADVQRVITDLNKVGTAALTPAERALADSRRVSQQTLDWIAAQLDELGPDATLLQALEGDKGPMLVARLIQDGVITDQEKGTYVEERVAKVGGYRYEVLTEEGKRRIERLLLGRLFRDNNQFEATPAELRNKLQRLVAPLVAVSQRPEWDLLPSLREAIDLLQEMRAHGVRNVDDYVAQQNLFGEETYTPAAVALAKTLQLSALNALRLFRAYASEEAQSRPGAPASFFEPLSPEEAFRIVFIERRRDIAGKEAAGAPPMYRPQASLIEPEPEHAEMQVVRLLDKHLRGGSQARLIEASDGKLYVVKHPDNPQGYEILVNEFVAGRLMERLGLPVGRPQLIEYTGQPEIRWQFNHPRGNWRPATLVGIPYAGREAGSDVYDFLPEALLDSISDSILRALPADVWLGQADSRQLVVTREQGRWRVRLIDQGYTFNGPHWDFLPHPLGALYFRNRVYAQIRSLDDLEPTLSLIERLPARHIREVFAAVPREWLRPGDPERLRVLADGLIERKKYIRQIMASYLERYRLYFPNFRPQGTRPAPPQAEQLTLLERPAGALAFNQDEAALLHFAAVQALDRPLPVQGPHRFSEEEIRKVAQWLAGEDLPGAPQLAQRLLAAMPAEVHTPPQFDLRQWTWTQRQAPVTEPLEFRVEDLPLAQQQPLRWALKRSLATPMPSWQEYPDPRQMILDARAKFISGGRLGADIVLLNRQASHLVMAALDMPGWFHGMLLSPRHLDQVLWRINREAAIHASRGNQPQAETLRELAAELAKAKLDGYVIAVTRDASRPLASLRHELHHLRQHRFRGEIRNLIPPEVASIFFLNPLAKKARRKLLARGYGDQPGLLFAEVGAHLASGMEGARAIGLETLEEARELFRLYLSYIVNAYGVQALDEFDAVAPEFRSVLEDARRNLARSQPADKEPAKHAQGISGGPVRRGVRQAVRTDDILLQRAQPDLFPEFDPEAQRRAEQRQQERIEGERLTAEFNTALSRQNLRKKLKPAPAPPQGNLFTGFEEPAQRSLFERETEPLILPDEPQGSLFMRGEPEIGPHGPILRQFRHDARGAVAALRELQTGEAVAALHHPEIGDIDLIWGRAGTPEKDYEDGYGLAHIIAKGREEILDRLQETLEKLPIRKRSANRIQLWDDEHRAIVRLDWDKRAKTWLLTLYRVGLPPAGRTTGVSGAHAAEHPQPGGTTSLSEPPSQVKRGERGAISAELLGIPQAEGALKAAAEHFRQFSDDFKRVFLPAARGHQALQAALSLRAHGAAMARSFDRVERALREARAYFRGKPQEFIADFIDRMEEGKPQANKQLDEIAALFRKFLDDKRREVQELGTGKLTAYYETYFPHIWKRRAEETPEKVFRQVFGRRPLEGPKAFLKKRKHLFFREGLDAGLEPVSWNPVELVLLKIREMDRYILAHRFLNEMKALGLAKFVPTVGGKAPAGWAEVPDPIGSVWGPPQLVVREAYDAEVMRGLEDLAKSLGIKHERVTKMRGRGWGYAYPAIGKVKTRFAGPESVLIHEIGHVLDERYSLADQLVKKPPYRDELRMLADLRVGEDAPEWLRRYARRRGEKIANMVAAYVHAPERFQEVAPATFSWFESFIDGHPELAPLKTIRYGMQLAEGRGTFPLGGFVLKGKYYMPEGAVGVLRNFLSPGLRQKGWFRPVLGLANWMVQFTLSWSTFHLANTSLDAMISKLSLAMNYAAAGMPVKALRRILEVPGAPIRNAIRGDRLLKAWFADSVTDPEVGRVLDAALAAGARVQMDPVYRTGWRERWLDALAEIRDNPNLPAALRLAWATPFALTELAAWPIMEFVVPRMKLGAFYDMVLFELERLPADATREEVRAIFARAWDSVDNRLGQLVYDNLFWNRYAKDIGMVMVQSLGWNLGSFREMAFAIPVLGVYVPVGGAVGDVARLGRRILSRQPLGWAEGPPPGAGGTGNGGRGPGGGGPGGTGQAPGEADADAFRRLPANLHRIGYTIGIVLLTGLMGGIWYYLRFGKPPDDSKDWFFPPTGNVDADGTIERVNLPTYFKDMVHWYEDPVRSARNKLNPVVRVVAEILVNEDFWGRLIRDPHDPSYRQLLDALAHFIGGAVPISVQAWHEETKRGASTAMKLLPFAGITRAPRYITDTPAEKLVAKYRGEHDWAPISKEKAERQELRRQIVQALRERKPAGPLIAQALRQGKITREDLLEMIRQAATPRLVAGVKGLELDQALHVWEVASPKERDQIRGVLILRLYNAAKNKPPEELRLLRQRHGEAIREITTGGRR